MFNRTPKRGRLLRALVAGVVIISFGLVGCTGTEGQTAQTGDSKPGRIPLLKFGDSRPTGWLPGVTSTSR
jgi:hypothetical protein